MSSTATRETQAPSCELLLEILLFALWASLTFAPWIHAQVPAIVRALTHLHTNTINLFKHPQREPFPFLDLPPELRNLVYTHHFTLYRTPHYQRLAQETVMLPDALLAVNRQIYEEASHVLYSASAGIIRIAGRPNVHGAGRPLGGRLRTLPHALQHMNTVHLEILWSQLGGSDSVEDCSIGELTNNINTACASLAQLPHLRRICIRFFVKGGARPLTPFLPERRLVLGVLSPLMLVRRARPGVVLEMPDYWSGLRAELVEGGVGWGEWM